MAGFVMKEERKIMKRLYEKVDAKQNCNIKQKQPRKKQGAAVETSSGSIHRLVILIKVNVGKLFFC